MRVFLTGATGVIGTRALPALIGAGHQVTAVARTEAKADLVRSLGGTPVGVDLFDAAAVKAGVEGHEAVVHLATNIPPLTKAMRASAWATNDRLRREASRHLADAALAAGAGRYVQESICFPYLDQGDGWVDEASPLEHSDFFAAAGAAEEVAADFGVAAEAGVALRFAQFYSADSAHVRTFNSLLRKRVNPFVGEPDAFASFIHADDAGAAVAAALSVPSGIYNVGDDEPLTRNDAGRAAAAALGVKPPRSLPRLLRRASPTVGKAMMRSLRVSNHRFREASGWAPAHPSMRGSWPAT